MAGQADIAVMDKENVTPSGLSTVPVKRAADWEAEKGEPAKKKGGLRPSTRVSNVANVTKEASHPFKPAVMGPPPSRAPLRTDDGAKAGPSRTLVQASHVKSR